MKKSFKKAGAAVLSMAMLLAMGAVSTPLYVQAAEPGKVTVKIANLTGSPATNLQGEGSRTDANGDGSDSEALASSTGGGGNSYVPKYDYLKLAGVTEATVTMYRVAELDGTNGWDWEDYIKDGESTDADGNLIIPGFTSFEELLKNQGEDPTATKSAITNDYEFKTSSEDLKQMSNWLERKVLAKVAALEAIINDTNSTAAQKTAAQTELNKFKIGSGTVNNSNFVTTGVQIPTTDPNLLDEDGDGVISATEAAATQNKKGYYIIITETEQSGVLVQPVLISLKNNESKEVTVKGSTIDISKKMTKVTYDTDTADKQYEEADVLTSTGKSAVVAKEDRVYYEIAAQLPKYDQNVNLDEITDFVISDTTSDGLTINKDSIKVYLVSSSEESMTEEQRNASTQLAKHWDLEGNANKNVADYQLTMAPDNHGFDITITGRQMRELDADDNKEVDSLTGYTGHGSGETMTGATRLDEANHNKGKLKSMENAYIYVKFYATVDGTDADGNLVFDRTYTPAIGNALVSQADWNAVGEGDDAAAKAKDVKKQIDEAKVLGKTRYNKTYTADTYKADVFSGMTDEEKTALTALAKAVSGVADMTFDKFFITGDDTSDPKIDAEANRIQFMLAKDKHNVILNGEYNTAKMTYGNRYSSGGGEASVNTDYQKVYSVDLTLDKFAQKSMLTAEPTIPVSQIAGFTATKVADGSLDLAALKIYTDNEIADVVTKAEANLSLDELITALELTGTYADDSAKEAAINTALNSYAARAGAITTSDKWGTDLSSLTDIQKKYAVKLLDDKNTATQATEAYTNAKAMVDANTDADYTAAIADTDATFSAYSDVQKAAAVLALKAENTRRTNENYYSEKFENEPVAGAIFHLVKNYTTGDDSDGQKTGDDDLGYAVSTSTGKLKRLEDSSSTGATAYTFTDENGNEVTKYLPADAEDSWKMLDIGQYTLSEVYVPTGFKKWSPVTFTISADKAATATDPEIVDGEYKGSYKATSTKDATVTDSASHGLTSIEEHKADGNVINFAYYNDDGKTSSGVLSHNLYNEYVDKLPATGGMGTVLFTAGGIAVILMAGALFVVYMKKRNAEEEE